jgi:hypothetical protein
LRRAVQSIVAVGSAYMTKPRVYLHDGEARGGACRERQP